MPVWLIAGMLSGLGWGFAKDEVLKFGCVLAGATFGVWMGGFVLLPDETFGHEYPGRTIGILSVFAITAGLTFLSTLGGVAMSLLGRDSISLIRRFASRP